jgi:hypothetical protein
MYESSLSTDCCSENYLKVIGRTDIEDALARLDQLTQEEVRMAAAQSLKATHAVHDEVKSVDGRLQGVGSDVQQVVTHVQRVDDKIQGVDDKVQQVADELGDQKRSSSNAHLTGHERLIALTGDQLRKDIRNWISPPDPSVNYNTASDARHEGTSLWFMACDAFKSWKESDSLLWIYGKRTFPRPSSLLWSFISIAGSGKSVLTFVTPRNHSAGIVDLPLVHRSSRILTASLTRVRPTSLTSSLTSKTLESKIPTGYSLLSLSSSAINLFLSATFSLPVIQPTNPGPDNPVTAPSHNASRTCLGFLHRSQSILFSMRSTSALTRLEYRLHVARSSHSSRSWSS